MELSGKKTTVMGLGVFGGGVGVAKFLRDQGAVVTVTDLDSEENLRDSVAAIGGGVTYHLGGHIDRDFTDADILVANPAVRPNSPYLALVRDHGVAIETEMNLFLDRCPCRIIGVTGSVGKTTTTSMIYEVLKGDRTWLGGNIGQSLLTELGRMTPSDTVVLEISSAQLDRIPKNGRMPDIAVVTNISVNHLDWHGSMASYTAAKRKIVEGQREGGAAVLNFDDPELRNWARLGPARKIFFSASAECSGAFLRNGKLVFCDGGGEIELLNVEDMSLPGAHNIANAAAAAAACMAAGADPTKIGRSFAAFKGAEHRLEFVREVRGVRYYNDSKATTPESSLAALRAFDAPIVLILGGSDKGMSFDELARAAARCRAVILVGATADKLDALVAKYSPDVPRSVVKSLEGAVQAAAGFAKPGDVVLLSPACASFDMFRNFGKRGLAFKEAVSALAAS